MKQFRSIAAIALATLVVGVSLVQAGPVTPRTPVDAPSLVSTIASCQQIAQQIAAQQGGRVSDAREMTKNGRKVCVVVVEGKGKRAQRVTVPMN